MFLDKSRIPVEKLDDHRLKKQEAEVLEAMDDPAFRRHVCLHEAAHGVYLERAGAKRLIYHGPLPCTMHKTTSLTLVVRQ
jgi:hypothetical protein